MTGITHKVETEPADLATTRIAAERKQAFEYALAGLSHAMGTPLQVIAGRASLILAESQDPEALKHAEIIERKVRELAQVIAGALEFARPSALVESIRLGSVLAAVVEELRASRKVMVGFDAPAGAVITAVRDVVVVAFTCLLEDLIADCEAGAPLHVRVVESERHVSLQLSSPGLGASAWSSWGTSSADQWLQQCPASDAEQQRSLRRAVGLGALKRLNATRSSGGDTLTIDLPRNGIDG